MMDCFELQTTEADIVLAVDRELMILAEQDNNDKIEELK
jgi:hypothetical protein